MIGTSPVTITSFMVGSPSHTVPYKPYSSHIRQASNDGAGIGKLREIRQPGSCETNACTQFNLKINLNHTITFILDISTQAKRTPTTYRNRPVTATCV